MKKIKTKEDNEYNILINLTNSNNTHIKGNRIHKECKEKRSRGISFRNSKIKPANTFLISFLILINQTCLISLREVSCEISGVCKISYLKNKQYIPVAFSVNYNFFQDKNLKESIKISSSNNTNLATGSLYSNLFDPNIQLLVGSKKYQCADGLNECLQKCCKLGLCSDPSNVCLKHKMSRDIILIVTSSIFILLAIIYWIIFFYLGIKYNKQFLESKSIKNLDLIYRKPFKKISSNDNDDIDKENLNDNPDIDFNPNMNYENFNKKKEDEENMKHEIEMFQKVQIADDYNLNSSKNTHNINNINNINNVNIIDDDLHEIKDDKFRTSSNTKYRKAGGDIQDDNFLVNKNSLRSELEMNANQYKRINTTDENYILSGQDFQAKDELQQNQNENTDARNITDIYVSKSSFGKKSNIKLTRKKTQNSNTNLDN